MKKFLIGLVIAIGIVGAGLYAFREPLFAAMVERMTADMFVARDTDNYDPGVATGQTFPAIRALYQGREVTSVADFMGKRGLVIFVNRSVDW